MFVDCFFSGAHYFVSGVFWIPKNGPPVKVRPSFCILCVRNLCHDVLVWRCRIFSDTTALILDDHE